MPRNGAACLDKVVVSRPYANQDTLPTRFNWRLRAPSRIKKNEKKDKERKDGEGSGFTKRLRPVDMGTDVGKPFYNAIQHYSAKYVAFLLCLGPFFIELSFSLDF